MLHTLIKFKSIYFNYGNDHPILQNVNLDIQRGSFHFLTGKSGAGKSSLLKLMYLESKPNHGEAYIFNKPVRSYTRNELAYLRQKISVIFQDYKLIQHMTIFENIALPLQIKGEPKTVINKKVEQLLNWVGLKNYMNELPETLSGGQQQRAAIARSVITSPELILADEPTGSVDEVAAQKIMSLFSQLHKQGTTIIMATHNQSLVNKNNYPEMYIENHNVFIR